jgi:hypothetical protein
MVVEAENTAYPVFVTTAVEDARMLKNVAHTQNHILFWPNWPQKQ